MNFVLAEIIAKLIYVAVKVNQYFLFYFLKLDPLYSQINTNIARYGSFDSNESSVFNSLIAFKKVVKKTILLYEGEV